MKKKGQALIAVVLVTLVTALVLIYVLLGSRRLEKQAQTQNAQMQFQEFDRRSRSLFEILHLCTCNLRGLKVQNVSGSKVVLLDSDSADPRRKFGFYTIRTENSSDPNNLCLEPVNGITGSKVAMQIAAKGQLLENPQNQFKVNYLKIYNFVSEGSAPQNTERYRATLQYAAESQLSNSQVFSNQKSPAELTVYLELENLGPDFRIKQCYQPQTAAPVNCVASLKDNPACWASRKAMYSQTYSAGCKDEVRENMPPIVARAFSDLCLPGFHAIGYRCVNRNCAQSNWPTNTFCQKALVLCGKDGDCPACLDVQQVPSTTSCGPDLGMPPVWENPPQGFAPKSTEPWEFDPTLCTRP